MSVRVRVWGHSKGMEVRHATRNTRHAAVAWSFGLVWFGSVWFGLVQFGSVWLTNSKVCGGVALICMLLMLLMLLCVCAYVC